jgi:hypothetical protein
MMVIFACLRKICLKQSLTELNMDNQFYFEDNSNCILLLLIDGCDSCHCFLLKNFLNCRMDYGIPPK